MGGEVMKTMMTMGRERAMMAGRLMTGMGREAARTGRMMTGKGRKRRRAERRGSNVKAGGEGRDGGKRRWSEVHRDEG